MKKQNGQLQNLFRSGFVRSVVTRVMAIFIIVSVIIAVVAFFSFTSSIRRSILDGKQMQLAIVEATFSDRMEEIASLAYNIGSDPVFYLSFVEENKDYGREMSAMLKRYLVGNRFVEHLAYCRTSEPDKIFVPTGERSLTEFFVTTFNIDKEAAGGVIEKIHNSAETDIRFFEGGQKSYFAYSYPLPQLTSNPQAHVLIMIPVDEIKPLLETLHISSNGLSAVFKADGSMLYSTGNIQDSLELENFVAGESAEEEYKSPSGQKYVLQKTVSKTNGWTYVSVLRQSDTQSGLAEEQITFILLVLLLFVVAIVVMLFNIVLQFKPISNLAAQVAKTESDDSIPEIVDERSLLSDTIATLKDDSEQKAKYEAAYYEAESASNAKSAFLSSMSHDIRTPMNAIIGMTAIARKHIGDQKYVDECLQKVQMSSDYLLDIINNVLDMSRIESGRIPIVEEPVIIPALMDSVLSLMTSSAEAKRQTLRADIGELSNPVVLGDSIHIVQVFVNIVSNAVKFTPEGGAIELTVRQVESDNKQVGNYIFTFSDNGIGISPEFVGSVFDTFTRESGLNSAKTEGTGLGMAIAKKLTELMGGEIKCESELGRGTTFTVSLHMKYADESDAPADIFTSAKSQSDRNAADDEIIDLKGKRILLVEDNSLNRMIASNIINDTGADIVEATNGEEAVTLFNEHPDGYFDLIFMDIQMPVMNGYEAATAIRNSGKADALSVPIYAMTANTFDEDVRRVRDAGMSGHIGKPYNPHTLYVLLSNVFKR